MSEHAQKIPWVVAEGPHSGDAEFTCRWLSTAIKADRLFEKYYSDHAAFRAQVQQLGVVYAVEFSPAAMAFVAAWFKGQGVFSLSLFDSQWAENFAFMTGSGFFTRTDGRYQMTIPNDLNMNSVGRALLELAATGDRDFPSYPERLLTTMTKEEAHHCVRNLRRLTWNGRIAHRNALLAESGRSPIQRMDVPRD